MATGQKTGGRQKGTPNKLSMTVKENVINVFDSLGGTEHMKEWAIENPTQFYNIYAKLLPTEITGDADNPLQVISTIQLVALDDDSTD